MTAIAGLRTTLADRRNARTNRRLLERELAAFTTAAQRAELEAIMSRYTPAETQEIREILDGQGRSRTAGAVSLRGHLAA